MVIDYLRQQPVLLFFFVIAIGFSLERIPIVRRTFGVSTVLFVGLFVGALDPQLKIPGELYDFGLVLFVYMVGLSCGPTFFRTAHKSLSSNCLVACIIFIEALFIIIGAYLLQISPAKAAGFFAGALTNTPALASVREKLVAQGAGEAVLAEPIVGYSIAYPISIVSVILAIRLVNTYLKTDYSSEAKHLIALGAAGEEIRNVTVRVMRYDLANIPIRVLFAGNGWRAVLGRRLRDNEESLVQPDTTLEFGDLVSVIGTDDDVGSIVEFLGQAEPELTLGVDRGHYDNRRIFLSKSEHFGRRIGDLNLFRNFETIITRVRRGDNDFLATSDFILEPGDRVRVVAPRSNMKAVTEYLGDSYRSLSEIDYFSLSIGLLMGFFVGQIPLPAPTGYDLRLGMAGGPLLVALLLGWAGRTGPLVWNLPYSANMTLRQIGILLFLAGVGTQAGNSFVNTVMSGGWFLMLLAAMIVATSIVVTLLIGHCFLSIPMSVMIGVVAGMQTQPALLSYATEQTGNDSPSVGYTSAYPLSMVLKILMAQWVLMTVSS